MARLRRGNEKQRHMQIVPDFLRQIDKTQRRDQAHVFVRLASNTGKFRRAGRGFLLLA